MVKQLRKLFRLDDRQVTVQDEERRVVVTHQRALGKTGSENYSGYAAEEYLYTMRGKERADKFDQMRRSDPQIKMCLSAVKDPIKSAAWSVQPGDDSPEAKLDAELIEHILLKDMGKPFPKFLSEALTFIEFGHSVFEVTHKTVLDHPKFGSYVGIKSLGFRSQRTIDRWNLDKETGELASVSQQANGDAGAMVDIPIEFLLVFTLQQEGSNYEGISAIRPCYGNWFRKDNYLKLNAIGIEKFAVPTPIVKIPEGKGEGESYDRLVAALAAYTSHESNYLIVPAGWEVELNNNPYDPQKVEVSIDNEDKRMVKAFMANFLELGMNGFGSQSLSFDLSDFFLNSLDQIAQIFSSEINQVLIPKLVQLNRGTRATYPKLVHAGISDRAGEELATVLKGLREGDYITPDDQLEVSLRKRLGLPEMSLIGQRAKPSPSAQAFQQFAETQSLRERVRARRLRG